jgi:hypothetical protein
MNSLTAFESKQLIRITSWAALLVGVCMLLACASQAASQATVSNSSPKNPSYLFVQTAASATVAKNILTLHRISNNTVWFTDRPLRQFGNVNTAVFINQWQTNDSASSFKKDPPNAVLVSKNHKSNQLTPLTVGLTLSSPVFNAKTDSLSYVISEQTLNHLKGASFNDVAIFFDFNLCKAFAGRCPYSYNKGITSLNTP